MVYDTVEFRVPAEDGPCRLVIRAARSGLFGLKIGATVSFILKPWQLFFVVLSGWVDREQQKTIEFYPAELEAMMKAQGKKRLLLTDDGRRLLP